MKAIFLEYTTWYNLTWEEGQIDDIDDNIFARLLRAGKIKAYKQPKVETKAEEKIEVKPDPIIVPEPKPIKIEKQVKQPVKKGKR